MGSLLLFKSRGGRQSTLFYRRNLILLFITLFVGACGVKGDPLPPERAPYIGSGEPNFKGGISGESIEEEPVEEEPVEEELIEEVLIEEEYEEY